MTTTHDPIPCPISFARALRRNAAEPRGHVRDLLVDWLRYHGWQHSAHGWRDPFERDSWSLTYAILCQATREAQRLLVPLDWEMTCGSTGDGGVWQPYVLEVRKRGQAGYCTLTAALSREGIVQAPSMPRVHLPPRLRLVQGGRVA